MDGTPWLGVSSWDRMERLYIRLRPLKLPKGVETLEEPQDASTQDSFLTPSQPKPRGQMNVAPMRVLMEKANAIIEEQTKEKDRQIEALLSADFSPQEPCDSALWVDKYSPKGYAELLSDDGINRMLLTWVKMWDECASKKKPPSVEHLSELEQRNLELESTLKPARPRLRTAMLYGQPGMGKTTLAKIIARQAGYNPIDVNASGDRKVDYLKGLIEGVVRSVGSVNSMQENSSKPSCLIIDEIDGAHIETIKYLVTVVSDKGRYAIRRPIICICNNLFATALRSLKPHAFLLEVPSTRPNRLYGRLRTICENEKLWLDRAALQRVVEGCFDDIPFKHSPNAEVEAGG
uniref:AAA domain-containing protein n=1 Tax=Steinernema glaseri TaxID=37863 RepID=A0A1I8A3U7_9BILA